MAIAGELKSADATTSAQLVPTGTSVAVQFVHYRSTGTAGTIILKNGGSSGTGKMEIHAPSLAQSNSMPMPSGGLHFDDGVYVDMTNVDGITMLYQEE